jgi:hypothetical protein
MDKSNDLVIWNRADKNGFCPSFTPVFAIGRLYYSFYPTVVDAQRAVLATMAFNKNFLSVNSLHLSMLFGGVTQQIKPYARWEPFFRV